MRSIFRQILVFSFALAGLVLGISATRGSPYNIVINTTPFDPDPTLINTNASTSPVPTVKYGCCVVEECRTSNWWWQITNVGYVGDAGSQPTLTVTDAAFDTGTDTITYDNVGSGASVIFTIKITKPDSDAPVITANFNQVGNLNITYEASCQVAANGTQPAGPASTGQPPTQTTTNTVLKILRELDISSGGNYQPVSTTQPAPMAPKTYLDALPGQLINLNAHLTVGNIIPTNFTWTIDGTIFASYTANAQTGQVNQLQSPLGPTSASQAFGGQIQKFYWADSGNHQVTVTETAHYFHDDNNNGHKAGDPVIPAPTASCTFAVEKPVVTFSAPQLGNVVVGGPVVNNGTNYPVALGLLPSDKKMPDPTGQPAAPDNTGGWGIVYTGKVTISAGWPTGHWNFTALITPDAYSVTSATAQPANTTQQWSQNGQTVLDTRWPAFPVAGGNFETGPTVQPGYDAPCNGDPGDGKGHNFYVQLTTGDQLHQVWLMFLPPGPNSAYVPTQMMSFDWGGNTTANNAASAPASWANATNVHQNCVAPADTTNFPLWTADFADKTVAFWTAAPPLVMVNIPPTVSKTSPAVPFTLSVSTAQNFPLSVDLSSSSPTILEPATDTISANTTTSSTSLMMLNGTAAPSTPLNVRVTPQVIGYTSVSSVITITP